MVNNFAADPTCDPGHITYLLGAEFLHLENEGLPASSGAKKGQD